MKITPKQYMAKVSPAKNKKGKRGTPLYRGKLAKTTSEGTPILLSSGGALVGTEVRGLYTLPRRLVLDDVELTSEYRDYAKRVKARRTPKAYLQYVLGKAGWMS